MSITLYGSKTSPYVRRIRILLHGTDYKFSVLNIYDEATRLEYAKITPVRKIPLLTDGENTIFDSHVIADYVSGKLDKEKVTLAQQNLISVIDSVCDSLIVLFLANNSDIETSKDVLYFKLQYERIVDSLNWIEEKAEAGDFTEWNYATICLVSLIGWVEFRGLYDLSTFPALLKVRDAFADLDAVKATQPE